MSETIIKIDHVSKEYRLGAIGGTTLRADLQRLTARIRKKDDPTKKIGYANNHMGETFLALEDVSFEVKQGEALGIIGGNGAGKSTLLKLLCRVTAPTRGTISYNGRVTSMLEVGTGFHPELTGRENVFMNGAILGMSKAEITKKFDEIVSFADMEQFIDTPVKRYSSGMYVRLAFAVAAHLDAEILVMDEVLAVGDMSFQQKALNKMSSAANQYGRTILYVSHNMETVRQFCDRVIVLRHGKLEFEGGVDDGIAAYMNNENQGLPAFYDLSDNVRKSNGGTEGNLFRINSVEFVGKKAASYRHDEKIVIKCDWESRVGVPPVQLKLSLRNEASTLIGGAYSEVFAKPRSQERGSTVFQIDTQDLIPGKYFFQLYVFSLERGNQTYDKPGVRFFFAKVSDEILAMPWNPLVFGNVRFDNITIIESTDYSINAGDR